jgi:hypothetical protein
VSDAAAGPSVEQLAHEHDCAKRAVLRAAADIRARYATPDERAAAFDRWLRGLLTGAYGWAPGNAAPIVHGIADGLAEVGQP